MPNINKYDMVNRCCICLHLLSMRPLTIRELSQESGIPISSIRRYLDAISTYFPVIEEETKTDRGAICMQYHISGLINKDKLKQDLKRELNYLIDKSL